MATDTFINMDIKTVPTLEYWFGKVNCGISVWHIRKSLASRFNKRWRIRAVVSLRYLQINTYRQFHFAGCFSNKDHVRDFLFTGSHHGKSCWTVPLKSKSCLCIKHHIIYHGWVPNIQLRFSTRQLINPNILERMKSSTRTLTAGRAEPWRSFCVVKQRWVPLTPGSGCILPLQWR